MSAFREWPIGARLFMRNIAVLPFQAALGATSIWQGIGAFSDQTIAARLFNDALPNDLSAVFNVIYVVAGFALVCGLGWAYRNLESFGLVLLIGVLFVRAIVVSAHYGYSPYTSAAIVQAVIFGLASGVRFVFLAKRWTVLLLKSPNPLEAPLHD